MATRAPMARAIWVAICPVPPAPPWISTRSPGADPDAFHHRLPSGDEDKRNGGGIFKGDAVGHPDKAIGGHHGMAGIGAVG